MPHNAGRSKNLRKREKRDACVVVEVTGFAHDDTGVGVEISHGRSLRAEYLVVCDGGRILIRMAAGIEFPGWDPTTGCLIAEVEMGEAPE